MLGVCHIYDASIGYNLHLWCCFDQIYTLYTDSCLIKYTNVDHPKLTKHHTSLMLFFSGATYISYVVFKDHNLLMILTYWFLTVELLLYLCYPTFSKQDSAQNLCFVKNILGWFLKKSVLGETEFWGKSVLSSWPAEKISRCHRALLRNVGLSWFQTIVCDDKPLCDDEPLIESDIAHMWRMWEWSQSNPFKRFGLDDKWSVWFLKNQSSLREENQFWVDDVIVAIVESHWV